MNKISVVIITLWLTIHIQGQVKYSTSWFGPNANPVPEFTDATITDNTTVSVMADYYYNPGDKTKNIYVKTEIPLIPERVSIKLWSVYFEFYDTDNQIMTKRNSAKKTGMENGDLYVQTRILLCTEQKYRPAILLNSTLKTASAKTFTTRRYFDTPGYYFDLEMGKDFRVAPAFLDKFRVVTDMGFMSYETSGSLQNDAPMYGLKLITAKNNLNWSNSLSGYWGWLHTSKVHSPNGDYGDTPLVFTSKINFKLDKITYFFQYQYGIKDFPYQQFRVGVDFKINTLTPHFKQ